MKKVWELKFYVVAWIHSNALVPIKIYMQHALGCHKTIGFIWLLINFLGGRPIRLERWSKSFCFALRLGGRLTSLSRIFIFLILGFVLNFGGLSHKKLILRARLDCSLVRCS